MSRFRVVVLDEEDHVVRMDDMTDEGLHQATCLAGQLLGVLEEEEENRVLSADTEPETCVECGSDDDMTYSRVDDVWHCGKCGIANMPVTTGEAR